MFDRICREFGITHRLTKPRSPTTTGKIERFHLSLRRSCWTTKPPFASVADAQAAIDVFRRDYDTDRPHQGIGMAFPADRFRPNATGSLPLKLPPSLAAPADVVSASPTVAPLAPVPPPIGLAVEVTQTVPASGNIRSAPAACSVWPDGNTRSATTWPDAGSPPA